MRWANASLLTWIGWVMDTRYRKFNSGAKWNARSHQGAIQAYNVPWLGYLPQGAPTSPKLSNLALRGFDQKIRIIAGQHGLTYSRYADDLTLSTRNEFDLSLIHI